jgi:hypothetical protein
MKIDRSKFEFSVEENINITVIRNMMTHLADWYQRNGGIYGITSQVTTILTFSTMTQDVSLVSSGPRRVEIRDLM